VVIASASPAPALRYLPVLRGCQIVATEFEVRDNHFTGFPSTPECVGEEKARRVSAYLTQVGVESLFFAYSDSFLDEPLMRMAEKPTWVHPNQATRAKLPADAILID